MQDWLHRFFSLRCLTFILIVLLLAVFEFRFDWMEKALGSYLSTTNRQRPEIGVIWETAHHTQQAQESLDEITVDRETIQSSARSAMNLSDIVSLIEDNQPVTITPDHFCSLYTKLPSSIKTRIISPMELLQYRGENRWERTYIRKFGNQLSIYLIDRNNRVLREIVVPDNILVQIERGQVLFEGSLEEWGASEDQIFPAEKFFSALRSLPMDAQYEIIAQPEKIFTSGGHPVRVGLSPQLQTMWVDVGFELADGTRRRVVVLPAREWTVGRLRSMLQEPLTDPFSVAPEAEVPDYP
ncbi:MAG: hypothetical protein P8Z37_08050 [Acidobacteriota bacterium]